MPWCTSRVVVSFGIVSSLEAAERTGTATESGEPTVQTGGTDRIGSFASIGVGILVAVVALL